MGGMLPSEEAQSSGLNGLQEPPHRGVVPYSSLFPEFSDILKAEKEINNKLLRPFVSPLPRQHRRNNNERYGQIRCES